MELQLTPKNTFTEAGTDASQGGNSKVFDILPQSDGWVFHLRIQPGTEWPNAGLNLHFSDSSCKDMSAYESIEFELQAVHSKNLNALAFNGRERLDKTPEKSRILYHFFDPTPEPKRFQMKLKEFFIPEWVILQHQLELKRSELMWDQHCSFAIYASSYTPMNTDETIVLRHVRFVGFQTWKMVVGISLVGLISLLWIGWGIKLLTAYRKSSLEVKNIPIVLVPIQPLESREHDPASLHPAETNLWDTCALWLAQAYRDPELSTESAAKAVQLPLRRFTDLVKQNTGLGPKEYITKLRIEAAKELLAQSKLQIQEVAYQSGFNSVPHFNRVFKSETEMSPGEFRSQFQSRPSENP